MRTVASLVLLFCGAFDPPPTLPDGTEEATRAIATFRKDARLKVELFAAEPRLGNPVAIGLDERNRVFVAEEYRFNRGTEENRTRPFFLEDDLQIRALEDRLAMYRKFADRFEGGMDWFSRWSDQVRLLEDRDGDGHADRTTVFADGFNDPLDGLAAGVMVRDGDVYFTCIPNLWLLRDEDGDGKAEFRQSLHRGFGVNAGFLGHDLHGLVWGPEGKLYFSVGDRGFHLTNKEGQLLDGPRSGAVFRCDPDGSHLEVVARGLRNPQELAFDDFGNLFAADNNCDKGDHARLVYVLEGGDSGWNMAYQSMPAPYLTGPWHAERLWHLAHDDQPAWIVPPVGKIGDGPSGFLFDPGIGLTDRERGQFLLCNYTGNGGLEAFGLKPRGAGFEIVDYHDVLKPLFATDAEFGYDGKLYLSDFVKLEWDGPGGRGRIYTLFDPARVETPTIRQTAQLVREGFRQRNQVELLGLLGHADRRVRQRAQFTLAGRDQPPVEELQRLAKGTAPLLARWHAIWCLAQIERAKPGVIAPLTEQISDAEPEIRVAAIRVLGDLGHHPAADAIAACLADPSPRIRLHAAMALSKLKHRPAADPIIAMIRSNADADPFLRHAGVMALVAVADPSLLDRISGDPDRSVRLAAVLVLRRLRSQSLARFLDDPDPLIATEAARAIHDLPIEPLSPELARRLDRWSSLENPAPEALLRRSLDANFRAGSRENAQRIFDALLTGKLSSVMRREALQSLLDWDAPGPRDRVTGVWRPLQPRSSPFLHELVKERSSALLARTDGELQSLAVDLVARWDVNQVASTLLSWVKDEARSAPARVSALRSLVAAEPSVLQAAVLAARGSRSPLLRAEARDLLVKSDPQSAVEELTLVLSRVDSAIVERQRAFESLARLGNSRGDELLVLWLDRLNNDAIDPALELDLLEAIKARGTPGLVLAARDVEAKRAKDHPSGVHRQALQGGDAERGQAIFRGHAAAQCIRCHKVRGEGGTAGPDLTQVGARQPRESFVESLIHPDAKIVEGFGSVVLALKDGTLATGSLVKEDARLVELRATDGTLRSIARGEIEDRSTPRSAMPSMERVLSARELRDLVAFLASLK